ncbi:MAG: ATP synthase F1 subunit delta [Planctomycetota bacterium]
MNERTVARRYAMALISLADQGKAVEAIETEILQIADSWRGSLDLRRAMTHPLITTKAKKDLFRQAFPGLSKLMGDFLDRLIEKKRTSCIPDIAEIFDDLADRYAGVVRMTVESAVPLSDAQKTKLHGKLVTLSQGRKVELDAKVNPALLGGVRLRVRDSVVDDTVAGRLKGLKELLTSTMR